MRLHEGELFHGRYRIVSLLGEGSIGAVYRAVQTESGKEVAIKLLQQTGSESKTDRERFQREFKILAQLCHDHIVSFYSAAVSPEGYQYAVFEFINGADLHQVITREQRLPYLRTMKIAEQICLAMEYAHEQGIIHRDLKPENIMLLETPEPDWVKILDFGFAREISPAAPGRQTLTATGMVVGTVCYLSPEQCRGGKASIASDIYALACIIYECLSGRLLFEAPNPLGVVQKQIYENPLPALKQLHGRVPDKLIAVLKKALNKEPEARHQSMRELRIDLQSLPKTVSSPPADGVRKAAKLVLASVLIIGLIAAACLAGRSFFADKKKDGGLDPAHTSHITRLLAVQTPDALMDDAARFMDAHDFGAAELRLNMAIERAERDKDQNAMFYAELYLARLSLRAGDLTAGRQRAENAVSTAKKYFGKESIPYFRAMATLATACKDSDPQQAESIYRDLLKQWVIVNQTANEEFVDMLGACIDLLRTRKKAAEVEPLLGKYKNLFDGGQIDTGTEIKFLCLTASSKYAQGKKSEADALAARSEDLASNAHMKADERARYYVLLSHMYAQAGVRDKAQQLIHEAQRISRVPGAAPMLATLYMDEADFWLKGGDAPGALACLDRAYLLIRPRTTPKPDALLSEICLLRVDCFLKLSKLDDARTCVEEAVSFVPPNAKKLMERCEDARKRVEAAGLPK
jgi:serine/threonine protein kinase